MVKKKTDEYAAPVLEQVNVSEVDHQKENAEVVETEEVKTKAETTEIEGPTNGNQPEKESDYAEVVAESQDTIPDYALAYLKQHVEVKEVYIDKLGGVFSLGTPRVFLKDAVFYQNPFYKQ